MQIGEFTRTRSGFTGRITTITLDFEMALVPAEASDTEGAPDYRAHLGLDGEGPEIGAGWDRKGERAGPYVAVQLDCPALVQPLRANLFRSGADAAAHHLVWNRPNKRDAGRAKSDERALIVRGSSRSIARRGAAALAVAALVGLPPISTPAIAQTTAAASPTVDPIARHVAEASQRFGVPEAWIYAVMGVESAGDRHATSPKGAMGLMQVMPGTYADLRARYGFGADPYDPRDNILAGTAYLREMYDRYGSPGFLAAYNAGPGRYEDYLAGRALPGETRLYLARLGPAVGTPTATPSAAPDPLAWTRAALFAGRWGAAETAVEPAPEPIQVAPPTDAPAIRLVHAERPLASLFVPLSGDRR